MAVVKSAGYALRYASEALKNDREVVLAAVQKDGEALIYASEVLKNDREVILAAVQQNASALEYVGGTLRNDNDVLLAVSKWCLADEKYLEDFIGKYINVQEFIKKYGYHKSPKLLRQQDTIKLLEQAGPGLLGMMPHRLGELSGRLVSGIKNPVTEKDEVIGFNVDCLGHIGGYLNYIEKLSLFSAVRSQRVTKVLSLFTHGLNKLKDMAQDALNATHIKSITPMLFDLAHRSSNENQAHGLLTKNVDKMRHALMKRMAQSSEVVSIEHMALFFEVASSEDANGMIEWIQTTLKTDQEARVYVENNADQLPKTLMKAISLDTQKQKGLSLLNESKNAETTQAALVNANHGEEGCDGGMTLFHHHGEQKEEALLESGRRLPTKTSHVAS